MELAAWRKHLCCDLRGLENSVRQQNGEARNRWDGGGEKASGYENRDILKTQKS